VANCVISGNAAQQSGGGVICSGANGSGTSATIKHSTFSGNSAANGGAIAILGALTAIGQPCRMTVADTTVTGNSATSDGGGIWNSGALSITTSTVSANESSNGGGVHNTGSGTIVNSTISGNSASGDG